MAKAGGTYPSIIQGVSNKEPQHRRPGQTSAQVNMLTDPIRGLVRRRGTRFSARQAVTLTEAAREELRTMDVLDFSMDGVDYALLYRRDASALGNESFAFLYNKNTEDFLPINYEGSAWVQTLVSGGVSAATSVGRYVYLAGNTTLPEATQVNLWQAEENLHRLAVWFRVGKYSNTYTITLRREDGTEVVYTHETVSAAYPGTLDTSDIPFFDGSGDPRPDYQKDVNDRVNAYNSAVNEWIVTAAEAITPEAIAQEFVDQMLADGWAATRVGGSVLIDDEEFIDVEADDGGDNTTVYWAGQEVTDPTRMPRHHFHGKIVRVRPSGGDADESFFLEARLDNGAETGFGAVSWFEVAGVSGQIDTLFAQMIIHDGQAYVARDGQGLEAMAPDSGDHPRYVARSVGDGTTSPLPWFVGRRITMLSVFQDRLLVGSENYINASRTADYLNFFRQSVLSVSPDDPVEAFAHGSEGDVLKHAVLYNGNLIIFGERQQYGISGDQLFSPSSPLIRPVSSNRDSTDARPFVSGNYIFYSQYGEGRPSMHQFRLGAVDGRSAITDELSEEVDVWIRGVPLQIAAITAPNFLMFRTNLQSAVHLYRYEDDKSNGQRVVASWHEFQYAESLGHIVAISAHRKQGLVFTARGNFLVCDVLDFRTAPDDHGALDSRTSYEDRNLSSVDEEEASVVMSRAAGELFLLGAPADQAEGFFSQLDGGAEAQADFGVVSPAWVTPTNPFPRDRNGVAVLDGRMSLNRVTIDVDNTGGMIGEVEKPGGVVTGVDFEGRILGNSSNIIQAQPVIRSSLTLPVGREVRECSYTLRSKTWLPLNITGLAWVGQTFNNVRRVS